MLISWRVSITFFFEYILFYALAFDVTLLGTNICFHPRVFLKMSFLFPFFQGRIMGYVSAFPWSVTGCGFHL